MRKGRMLTQNSPGVLLEKHNAEYLEDVFLALCYQDNESSNWVKSEKKLISSKCRTFDKPKTFSLTRIKATLWKNFYKTRRNVMMTIFALLLPLLMDACTQFAFQHDPYHLPLAVINGELERSLLNCPRSFTNSCILTNSQMIASCVFLNELRDRTYEMTEYESYEDAVVDHRKNRNKGIVQFPSNFTKSLSEWILAGIDANVPLYERSSILVLLDNTEMAIRQQLQKDIAKAYKKMMEQTVEICTDMVNAGALSLPVQIEDPIFGSKSWNFLIGFQLGFKTIGILFCTMLFSAATLLDEKTEGSLDRVLCVGVSIWDILIGNIIHDSIMAVIFGLQAYFVMYHVLDQPLNGSPYLMITLFIITGFTGIFLGGAVGLATDRLIVAFNAVSGFNFAFMSVTGLIWPIEGAHKSLRWIIPYVPLTSTLKTVRDVAIKGYGLKTPVVAIGFAQVVLLMFASLLFEIIVVKMQKGAWNKKK